MACTWLNGTLFRKINKLGHFSCRNGFTTCASSTLSMHLSQQMIWNGQKMVLLYNLWNLDTIINNFSKFYGKVGVISWFLFRLIWKNYVLYRDGCCNCKRHLIGGHFHSFSEIINKIVLRENDDIPKIKYVIFCYDLVYISDGVDNLTG